ncbi:MAG: hypothetical protein KBF83_16280 [Pyrinomonadaceae bacterium]|nr:hypothetical protein [Pyrinomonadaceae bacterium]
MRLLVGTLIFTATASVLSAQQASQPAAAVKVSEHAKVIAELSAAGHGNVKNSPLSAEEVNESVQTLADGNRIVRKSSGKMYRNSEGRTRREMSGGIGGMLGTTYSMGQGISIASPAGGQLLSTNLRAAQVVEMTAGQGVNIVSPTELTVAQKRAIEERVRVTGTLAPVAMAGQGGQVMATGPVTIAPSIASAAAYTLSTASSKYDVKTEDLGTRDFEGVSAEGTRRITTIPAEAIGNERPIETVYERWFSKELGLVVYSKNTDPRFGEQTYRLTNIVRAEPDPSLFAVPTRRTGEPPTVYRTVAPGTPIVVNTTKPTRP